MKTVEKTGVEEERSRLRGVVIDAAAYAAAFVIAAVPFFRIDNLFAATAVFTAAATVILFVVSVLLEDVSVYDPYWSVAPPVMLLMNMFKYSLWNVNAVVLLLLVALWSCRLTANWLSTYRGVGHEDWRYAMYRQKLPPLAFQFVSFFGLQFMPTVVVYLGLVSALFAMQADSFAPWSSVGVAVMLAAVVLEYVSDRAIHRFLRERGEKHRTCNVSVWRYSRHPNYLGEMSFWTGLYLYFLARCPEAWYCGLGVLLIIALFLFVSIPMMEKHNLSRRADYEEYRAKTSMLLLLPVKKGKR